MSPDDRMVDRTNDDGPDTERGGRRLTGDLTLHELLGRGGFGEVYRAHQSSLGRSVAVKLIRSDVSSDNGSLRRFRREAMALGRLAHPHIVTIHDVGRSDDNAPYIVMEMLKGNTLASVMKDGPLGVERSRAIAIQLADALSAAHEAGVVHRDLSPRNVFVREDTASLRDFVTVLDFGLARLAEGDADSSSAGAGTTLYMSPEQVLGEPLTEASDLYSLGLIIYELCAGRRPFDAESSPLARLLQHVNAPIVPLQSVNPEVPDELAATVQRLLEKAPDARFASAAEVRDALRQRTEGSVPATPRRRRSSRTAWIGGATTAAVALVGLAWVAPFQYQDKQAVGAVPEAPAPRVQEIPTPTPGDTAASPRSEPARRVRQSAALAVTLPMHPRRALESALGVKLYSVPAGARVTDGKYHLGKTPITVWVTSGPQKVFLTKRLYDRASVRLDGSKSSVTRQLNSILDPAK
jgi:hypothetical protein